MKQRIERILAGIGENTYEREEILSLALLGALAGESVFMLGLPGVGKSMVARRLKLAFENARVFEYLMSRFSTPDEIFGPVSISKLKDEDCYERVTAGYLPEAEVIFLDEIWKAGPAIQNSLLTVLNEKIYLNGNREIALPVKAIIAASNELPAEGEGLEALWDRFLLRYIVEPLKSREHFANLIQSGAQPRGNQSFEPITDSEYATIRAVSEEVIVPDELIDVIFNIRSGLNKIMVGKEKHDQDNPALFYISDRRWKKAVRLMRTSAYLNGRKALDLSDILLLSHMLWNEDSQIPQINDIIVSELVKIVFSKVLEARKSARRHATSEIAASNFYSPDNIHYIIRCDDSLLKFAIKDYNKLLKSADLAYASETLDERLVLNRKGFMAVRVVTPGKLCINSYTYPLVTELDNAMSEKFLNDVGADIENMLDNLSRLCHENIFVRSAAIRGVLQEKARFYVERIKK